MSAPATTPSGLAGALAALPAVRALGAPLLIVMILAMMLVPLPAFLLDLLFTFNIALALVVLMVASYTRRTLDFASFPGVLLVTTLLRLALNVASTRAVLLNGHTGTGAAGQVIESFAHFLIGGSLAVGLVVFAILTIINFVVITKGAGRIAEVSARFALDAMPGKQMAIDADLAAGSIDEKEARRRRTEVTQEAEFYGSMDGASKFVRGDAIAGILILFINMIGGLVIGTLQHGLPVADAANNYVLLAIGDGLVAQVPALVISVAAGLIVSRVGEDDIGQQIASQLFTIPRALGLTGSVLGLLGLVPGMPHLPFLLLAGACGWGAWALTRATAQPPAPEPAQAQPAGGEASWDDVAPVDVLGLEVGYRLIALVDRERGGDLLGRIKGVRKKFAGEVGFLPPPVHIRDNLELHPSAYRILLKGAVVGEGQAFAGLHMAINPGHIKVPLAGTATTDPAFGLPATWIEARTRDHAQAAGYTVVDASTVVATHLNHVMQSHAADLLGRAEVQELVEHTRKFAPALVEDTVPKQVPLPLLQKVLRQLLEETIHIRDLRGILEVLAEHAGVTDAGELTRGVRIALSPAIMQHLYGPVRDLGVLAVEPGLEQLLVHALAPQAAAPLDPAMAELLCEQAAQAAQQQEQDGLPACLLVPDRIRVPLARLLRRKAPRLHVIAHSEIPRTHSIQIQRVIGGTA
ncbi:flagellar biosynthesis protein FlhA [Ramlibacter alkalitolerans]|uniref:Flagellar biosynthesis protein FlhA n=1 Tax=Ramlibacter alkalitolerans TaxID=2039631 RepID=A0ABS1JL00_9BURK|nr:flagellar biosynthesis protein FlhA [Ramlibacter alkalitolerans]MBL0424869.1 flagellar biosynthesis protein FlhA [Ramlibacter alkalitolerans]